MFNVLCQWTYHFETHPFGQKIATSFRHPQKVVIGARNFPKMPEKRGLTV